MSTRVVSFRVLIVLVIFIVILFIGFNLNEVCATEETQYIGTKIGAIADDSYKPVPIDFDFNFYGNTYNMAYASTNGLLTFGSGNSAYSNSLSFPLSVRNVIAPFWDDLVTGANNIPHDAIMYKTIGQAPNRKLIIQWSNMYFYNTTTTLGTFQVILYETTNKIQTQYRTIIGNGRPKGNSASIGIQNSDATKYVNYSINTESINEKQAISYTFNGDNYNINSDALYEWIYLYSEQTPKAPELSTGTPNNNSLSIPVNINLEWSIIENASSYRVYVSDTSDFSNIIVDTLTNNNLYELSNLDYSKTYYWRIEAINEYGSNMSNSSIFKTQSEIGELALVNTLATTNINFTLIDVKGEIINLGSPAPNQYGHVYSLIDNPTIDDLKTQKGSIYNIGEYTSNIVGLTEGTTYYIRAYVSNEEGTSYGETIIVTTLSSNNAPQAIDDNVTVLEDESININVLENDIDDNTITLVSTTQPTNGTLLNNGDGTLTYTPDNNFNGIDNFTYIIKDIFNVTDSANVVINITSVNDNPSTPGVFITPNGTEKIKGGEDIFVSWGSSYDNDSEGEILYTVDFYNGQQWIENVYSGINTSFTYSTTSVNTETAKFRVKAVDYDLGQSMLRYSNLFVIDSEYPSQIIINPSTTEWTNNNVTFTIEGGIDSLSDEVVIMYRINNGIYKEYNSEQSIINEGIHLIEAKVIDNVGNTRNALSVIVKIDKKLPVLYLNGQSVINIDIGNIYEEKGVSLYDQLSGISDNVIISGDIVNTNNIGKYILKYDITDNALNSATSIYRIVNVLDHTISQKTQLLLSDISNSINVNKLIYEIQKLDYIKNEQAKSTIKIIVDQLKNQILEINNKEELFIDISTNLLLEIIDKTVLNYWEEKELLIILETYNEAYGQCDTTNELTRKAFNDVVIKIINKISENKFSSLRCSPNNQVLYRFSHLESLKNIKAIHSIKSNLYMFVNADVKEVIEKEEFLLKINLQNITQINKQIIEIPLVLLEILNENKMGLQFNQNSHILLKLTSKSIKTIDRKLETQISDLLIRVY